MNRRPANSFALRKASVKVEFRIVELNIFTDFNILTK